MNYYPNPRATVFWGERTTSASSPAARYVAEQAENGRRHLQDSFSLGLGQEVFDELCSIAGACAEPGWDGHGAAPVRRETYQYAYRFLEALPLGTPTPTVAAEADGHLTLEWYRSPSRVLSVSVSPEGMIYYAALLGSSKRSGAEPFLDEAPDDVLRIIRRLFIA